MKMEEEELVVLVSISVRRMKTVEYESRIEICGLPRLKFSTRAGDVDDFTFKCFEFGCKIYTLKESLIVRDTTRFLRNPII